MIEVRVQGRQAEPACSQGLAVARMLLQHLIKARDPELDRRQPLREIASRSTNNGMLEHWLSPYRLLCAMNLS